MTENEAISAIQNDLEWHSKELKPKYKKVLEYAIQALEKVQQFEAIGTIEEFKALKEKSVAKKPIPVPFYGGRCAVCGGLLPNKTVKYCSKCGIIIDWSE